MLTLHAVVVSPMLIHIREGKFISNGGEYTIHMKLMMCPSDKQQKICTYTEKSGYAFSGVSLNRPLPTSLHVSHYRILWWYCGILQSKTARVGILVELS